MRHTILPCHALSIPNAYCIIPNCSLSFDINHSHLGGIVWALAKYAFFLTLGRAYNLDDLMLSC
uniref:Uncharacterized protein n=1 Tax=Arundo donax TaxID=35708 RepID=A0A0A9GF66_ARUDO